MKGPGPVVVYTSSRLALFAVTAAVLALIGLRNVLLLAVALVVSGLLSFVLLSGQRDAMSAAVVARSERMRQRMRERTEAEDEYQDDDAAPDAGGDPQRPDADAGPQRGDPKPPSDPRESGQGEP